VEILNPFDEIVLADKPLVTSRTDIRNNSALSRFFSVDGLRLRASLQYKTCPLSSTSCHDEVPINQPLRRKIATTGRDRQRPHRRATAMPASMA
jgi:hypothetical protein